MQYKCITAYAYNIFKRILYTLNRIVKMYKNYSDRDLYGPDFDDRLIKLVRANPTLYDPHHPNYRRNPARVLIWERISAELGASSRFLQTKWKNIRYNYLQELKALETGIPNANIRKRRFTADLSFLQKTAQVYNVKNSLKSSEYNSSDNDESSSSQQQSACADVTSSKYEVIEIENSDNDSQDINLPNSKSLDEVNDGKECFDEFDDDDRTSSPLLTPMVFPVNSALGCTEAETVPNGNIKQKTIETPTPQRIGGLPSTEIMVNAAKRKAASVPIPPLTPINDPIELYCLSLVDSLRNMPRSERERVKFEFAKILKDAKYKDES